MAFDLAKFVREAFRNTGPRNPLRKLSERERIFISACLVSYKGVPEEAGTDVWEQAAKTATEAATLTKKISEVLNGKHTQPMWDLKPLESYFREFEELPGRLHVFSVVLGGYLRHFVGKPGHQDKVMHNRSLIMASEFVRCRTGKYYDEHLAELFQAINNDSDLKDFSGDAIRRKREHFKKAYPLPYASVASKALKLAAREERESGHSDPLGATRSGGITRARGVRNPKTRHPESGSER